MDGFSNPKVHLEQYVTPPKLAAFILSQAELFEDLKKVLDLGCGTGILAVGSALLDAEAIGVDIDGEAIKIARRNAKKLGVFVEFLVCDVKDLCLKEKDFTTIMNPPFGIQRKHADRIFLEKAFKVSKVVYTIHSAGSEVFVKKLAIEKGFEITHLWKFLVPLKRTYSFHEKEYKEIAVEVFRLRR
ncbi:MAG: METTL5 family protein [Archaeoglobaceae archaeon]